MTDHVQPHILNKYELLKKVGSGAYGHVWKVSDKKTGQILALKKIFDAFQHSTDAQRTYREIMFLHQFKHENIIKLYNVYKAENDKDLYLVFQFMQADLHNAIGQKILKDVHNRFVMYQIVKGMKYLHSASVIHRDLKPSNILINSDCQIKICDFGLARSLTADKDSKDMVLTEQVATRWYRAPQVLLGSNYYGQSADIWSMGCILAQVLTGKPFFPGNSTLNQLERILNFTGVPCQKDIDALQSQVADTMIKSANVSKARPIKEWFKSGTPTQAIDLVLKMLQFNPHNRSTIEQILAHPYLSQFRDIKSEIQSKKAIVPPISDNKKLNLKQYRTLIYESLRKTFNTGQEKPTTSISIDRKSSNHRGSTNSLIRNARQHRDVKTSEHSSNSCHFASTGKNYYNSVQRGSPNTPVYSNKKILHSSYSQNNLQSRSSFTNSSDDEKMIKRKNSLKDLLKSRKTPIRSQKEKSSIYSSTGSLYYQPSTPSTQTNSINKITQYKYYKASQKEGKYCFGRA